MLRRGSIAQGATRRQGTAADTNPWASAWMDVWLPNGLRVTNGRGPSATYGVTGRFDRLTESGATGWRDEGVEQNVRDDFVSVEPGTSGIYVYGDQPVGEVAMVVIPWDQTVEVCGRIRRFARDHGDVRGIWQSSTHTKRLRLIALLMLTVVILMVVGHLAGEALPVGS